jgi:hypothetical protein
MKTLEELYQDPKIGMTSTTRFITNLKKENYDYTKKEIQDFFKKKPSSIQVHNENKPVYLPIEVSDIRDQYQIDLIVLVKSKATFNNPIDNIKKTDLRYIMTLIDVYSRKADARFF